MCKILFSLNDSLPQEPTVALFCLLHQSLRFYLAITLFVILTQISHIFYFSLPFAIGRLSFLISLNTGFCSKFLLILFLLSLISFPTSLVINYTNPLSCTQILPLVSKPSFAFDRVKSEHRFRVSTFVTESLLLYVLLTLGRLFPLFVCYSICKRNSIVKMGCLKVLAQCLAHSRHSVNGDIIG